MFAADELNWTDMHQVDPVTWCTLLVTWVRITQLVGCSSRTPVHLQFSFVQRRHLAARWWLPTIVSPESVSNVRLIMAYRLMLSRLFMSVLAWRQIGLLQRHEMRYWPSVHVHILYLNTTGIEVFILSKTKLREFVSSSVTSHQHVIVHRSNNKQ